MVHVRELQPSDRAALDRLATHARREGFRFLDRLREELTASAMKQAPPRAYYLVVEDENGVVGVGGVTDDPYVADLATGRLRHVYIAPDARRQGLGRRLLGALEARAWALYTLLRLRTDSLSGARFYEALGYEP